MGILDELRDKMITEAMTDEDLADLEQDSMVGGEDEIPAEGDTPPEGVDLEPTDDTEDFGDEDMGGEDEGDEGMSEGEPEEEGMGEPEEDEAFDLSVSKYGAGNAYTYGGESCVVKFVNKNSLGNETITVKDPVAKSNRIKNTTGADGNKAVSNPSNYKVYILEVTDQMKAEKCKTALEGTGFGPEDVEIIGQ